LLYPHATVIRVVLDNLNVHTKASLYGAFTPAEARRITRKLEFHFTPKHGSWLNVAECELAVLASQCLARRLGDIDYARREIGAWERQRNIERPTVKWHFTVDQARRKLHRLYPDPA
jgi:transposase